MQSGRFQALRHHRRGSIEGAADRRTTSIADSGDSGPLPLGDAYRDQRRGGDL